MKTQYPAGIVVEIPEPIRSQIQSIRESLGTITAKMAVEITVAGSSGLGYIPPGKDLSKIICEIDRIASEIDAFEVSFSEIGLFPNSFVFYLTPSDRNPFDSLHRALCVSSIPFPRESFLIDSISIYDLPVYDANESVCDYNRLYSRKLRPNKSVEQTA